jgi:hypothetical protein
MMPATPLFALIYKGSYVKLSAVLEALKATSDPSD